MARVHVSDEIWAEFRVASEFRPLNLVLGELVRREVDRDRSQRIRNGQVDEAGLIEALGRARDLHADLSAIISRIESRLDRTVSESETHWGDQI